MQRFLAFPVGFLVLLAPAGLAVFKAEEARRAVYFEEPVYYYTHLPPPEQPDAVFETLGFRPAKIREGASPVPRRFLAALPRGLNEIDRAQQRKRIFIATLLPLVLRANELILRERTRIEFIKTRLEAGRSVAPEAVDWLIAAARRYRLADVENVDDIDFDKLLARVDIIPPSLALAQGAIESGWGTSRFAREGNAVFGQWTWNEAHDGLVPMKRAEGRRYRVRAFDFLLDSVRGYMHNLNTAQAYSGLRLMRAQLRARNQPLRGLPLASTLIRYSERREAYIADLRAIITSNRLSDFNAANLASPTPVPLS